MLRASDVVAWILAAILAAAIVWRLQAANRAPLVWDEAARVDSGANLARTLSTGDLLGSWQWVHAQVFYPFLGPALNGVGLLLTHNSIAAAWVPSLAAFGLAGILSGRLAKRLGGGDVGAWCAAVMTWLTPIFARVAAGAFTEPIGACLLIATLLALASFDRHRTVWGPPVAAGMLAAFSLFLKYDYGLLTLETICLSGVAALSDRTTRFVSIKHYGVALATSISIGAAWFLVSPSEKFRGALQFVGQAAPGSAAQVDLLYYPKALFSNGEVGINPIIAVAVVIALASGIAQIRRREMRAPIISLVLWYLMYSTATIRYPRYLGFIVPLLAVFAGLAAGQLVANTHFQSTPVRRIALSVAAVMAAGQLAVQAGTSATGLPAQFWFLAPNPAAEAALNFAANHLREEAGSAMMLGQTNEFSPYALHLAWTERLGYPAPPVDFIGESGHPTNEQSLVKEIAALGAHQVVGVDVRPGSSLDTQDYRTVFPSQPGLVALARESESAGLFVRVADISLEDGLLGVTVWDYPAAGP